MLVALLALAFSMAGTATAASMFIITSGKQIKPGVIAPRHLDKALRAELQRIGAPGPRGPQGAPGAQGVQGIQGAPGVIGQVVVQEAAITIGDSGGVGDASVQCPGGEKLISGGVSWESAGGSFYVRASGPVDANGIGSNQGATPTGWYGEVDSSSWFNGQTYALCATS